MPRFTGKSAGEQARLEAEAYLANQRSQKQAQEAAAKKAADEQARTAALEAAEALRQAHQDAAEAEWRKSNVAGGRGGDPFADGSAESQDDWKRRQAGPGATQDEWGEWHPLAYGK